MSRKDLPVDLPSDDPTPDDLAAIELEWPLIEAEMLVLDAEIAILSAVRGPSELDWQRLRSARRRVLREAAALYDRAATTSAEVAA